MNILHCAAFNIQIISNLGHVPNLAAHHEIKSAFSIKCLVEFADPLISMFRVQEKTTQRFVNSYQGYQSHLDF